jgi:prepilin-type N-terminal cleavage/methylation domain-containing protein
MEKLQNILRREEGLTLLELLVVMIIIGILLALLGRSYLPQIFRAENTVAQDQAKIVYEGIRTCASDNDGIVGDWDFLTGAGNGCFEGTKVENKVDILQLPATGGSGSSCWNQAISDVDGDGVATAGATSAVAGIWSTPPTESNKRNTVYLCTFESVTSGGVSADHDEADSQYFRVSVTDNGKTYFFVQEPNGFRRCTVNSNDSGVATGRPRCR